MDYLWASDHRDLIAVLHQTRIVLFFTGQKAKRPPSFMNFEAPEELIKRPLYLVDFNGLRLKALAYPFAAEEANEMPEQQLVKGFVAEPLLLMRQLVETSRTIGEHGAPSVGLRQAASLAATLNHSTLWRLLADAALAAEQLDVTEEALVRCAELSPMHISQCKKSTVIGARVPTILPVRGLTSLFIR